LAKKPRLYIGFVVDRTFLGQERTS